MLLWPFWPMTSCLQYDGNTLTDFDPYISPSVCSAVVFPHQDHQKIVKTKCHCGFQRHKEKNSYRPLLFIVYFTVAGYLIYIYICVFMCVCVYIYIMLNNMISSQLTADTHQLLFGTKTFHNYSLASTDTFLKMH